VREIAEQVVAALTRIRSRGQGSDDVALRATVLDALAEVDLFSSQLLDRLGDRRLADLGSS